MPIPVTITLSSIVGSPGPFSLYSCTGSTCSGTPFVTGVTATGNVITSSDVPNGTTSIKIKSTGVGCDYEITKPIIGLPTITPTPTNTPTPTPTPVSTTITAKLNGTIEPSGNLECNTGTDIQVVINSNNFCTATLFTSSNFTSLGTNTYWLSYNGYYRSIFHTGSENTAINAGDCKECVGIEPTYYYYGLGDCSDLRYSGIEYTKFPFGPPLSVPVCMTEAMVAEYYETIDWGTQSLIMDYSNPCGFGEEYVPSAIGRSSTQLTEGDIYSISGNCWSIIEISPIENYTIELDGLSPFDGSCYDCIYGEFTGFTYSGYSVTVCGTGQETVAYANNLSAPVMVSGSTYPVIEYDENGNVLGSYCVTWGNLIGVYDGPLVTSSVFPTLTVPPGIVLNGGSVTNCDSCDLYYMLETTRCDGVIDLFMSPIWTDNEDVAVNDVITTDLDDNVCRKVTSKTTYKATPFYFEFTQTGPIYMDGYFTGVDACPDCITAGGSGGGEGVAGNVVSITPTVGQSQSGNDFCPGGEPYDSYSATVTFTFNGTSGPVTPDTIVEYSTNGSSYTTWTPTGSTFVQSMNYSDLGPCGGAIEIDNIRIKVNNIILLNYDLGD